MVGRFVWVLKITKWSESVPVGVLVFYLRVVFTIENFFVSIKELLVVGI